MPGVTAGAGSGQPESAKVCLRQQQRPLPWAEQRFGVFGQPKWRHVHVDPDLRLAVFDCGTGILGFAAVNETALSYDGRFLFAADAGSKDVSVFSINKNTGALTLLGSFATGGDDCEGMSLAEVVTIGGRILYASNSCSANISVFTVASDGTLASTSFSPVALGVDARPDGVSVRPDGKFLAVALPTKSDGSTALNKVAVFGIGPRGALTAVPGSPFSATGAGTETGVSYKCGSKILFGGEANATETIVDVYDVASNGALTTITGDPFAVGSGTAENSNVVLSSPASHLLFVSNQNSSTITDFEVASDGSLTLVGTFSDGTTRPAGMAIGSATDSITGIATTFLYAVNRISNNVAVFSVADGGALTLISSGPFGTGAAGALPVSVAAYPPLGCRTK